MRNIQFRSWDKSKKKLFKPFDIWEAINGSGKMDSIFIIIMQYTGLKDKNSKKIFEGDLVRILYTDWPSQPKENNGKYTMSLEDYKKSISKIGEVVYAGDRFSIDFHNGYGTGTLFEGTHGEKEVIGNIYENPELLK